ncbi:hypothetical protein PLCT2_02245 [Planctomycetaceae bacterium]|nr:hypothetical protein PLCT2_02245 [Planctomycetaceae bacterium]
MSAPPVEPGVRRALALATCGVVLLNLLALLFDNIWHAVAINHAFMLPLALWSLGVRRRHWLSLSIRSVLIGLGSGVILVLATWCVLALVGLVNSGWREWLLQPMAMKDALVPAIAIPLLVFPIIPGEEIVWRGAVMLPLVEQWGRVVGIFVAALLFAAAHVMLGSVPILLAAVALGVLWGALTTWTRSLWPALICHLFWDLMMLYVVKM